MQVGTHGYICAIPYVKSSDSSPSSSRLYCISIQPVSKEKYLLYCDVEDDFANHHYSIGVKIRIQMSMAAIVRFRMGQPLIQSHLDIDLVKGKLIRK
mmetsp:Transcript_21357/g.32913  ORF Transcript_21357/g.32913 Transcript_21357/m.32913 type:complete len:97 (+) Transcript_21357:204-494(+)